MYQFKIRCSSIGKLMSGKIGLTEKESIELNGLIERQEKGTKLRGNQEEKLSELLSISTPTDEQKEQLQQLLDKKEATKKLPTTLQERFDTLIEKRDNKELPKGVKTYIEHCYKAQQYDRRKEFSNKYTRKGNTVEDESIDFIGDALGLGFLMKNTERFSNNHIEGEPDVIYEDTIIDAKSSWDCFTFPLYEDSIDKDYWWQAQGYMILTGREKYILAYTLMDLTDEDEIMKLCWPIARAKNMTEIDEDLYLSVKKKYTYSDLPTWMRIKAYYFTKDKEAEKKIVERVEMAREYIKSLNYMNIVKYDKDGNLIEKKSLMEVAKIAA